jgi:hypothetical protein
MKKVYIIIVLTCLININQGITQTLLNGSFENNTTGCFLNLPNNSFNSNMYNTYGFGTASQLDMIENGCNYGSAENGSYFLGVAVDNTNTLYDAFSMALNAPLQMGTYYTLTFYNRKYTGYSSNVLEIGYSSDSLTFGTLIDSVPAPIMDTVWVLETMTFTPLSSNCKFITLQVKIGAYGWNHVDNFSINVSTGVNSINNDNSISVYPNPSSDIANIVVKGNEFTQLNATLHLYDVLGNKINCNYRTEFNGNDGLKFVMDTREIPNGFYFVSVEDGNKTYNSKVILQK